jgi:hypothetical protein
MRAGGRGSPHRAHALSHTTDCLFATQLCVLDYVTERISNTQVKKKSVALLVPFFV